MSIASCTVLMIGGDQGFFNDMLVKARQLECTLVTADSMESGLRCLAGGGIDVVVYDLDAAEGCERESVGLLRRNTYGIPILVLSERMDPCLTKEAIREGADDCLVKDHLHVATLERVIHNALARESFRQNRQQFGSRLNTLITHNADAIVVVGLNGVIRYVNPAAEAMFGRELARLVGTPFGCPITGTGRTEVDILRPGGPSTVAEMHLVISEWGDEQVYLATLRDISERKATEGALRQYQRIFTSFSDPIALLDPAGRVVLANRTFYRWFWPDAPPPVKARIADALAPAFFEAKLEPALLRCLHGEEVQLQAWIDLPGDVPKYATMTFDPFRDEDETVTRCIWTLRDLSETKNLEDQLRQSQKMEAIGTLAGGIAHNFNNLLMGIQGRSSLMLMDTGEDHPFVEHLSGIEALVREAAGLTKQLLGYARGGKYDPVPTDLNALVAKNLKMFANTCKELEIVETYAFDLWRVEVDRGQISQVLLNIFVNAWQAMPDGGRLSVTTARQHVDGRAAESCDLAPGRYAVVHIRDTGRGMDRATLHRIFDPFFTTKGAGRGTGLGLASAYGIVRNHGGFIDVDSDIGKGARFSIYLPATDKTIVAYNGTKHRVVKGQETILLVDDEPDVLSVGGQMLARLGYTVETASSGTAALKRYRMRKEAIDLVVLDMVMPGMGGGETFDRLRAFDPHVKVLLASGYSLEGQAEQIMARGCDGFIQKPFDISGLSVKLRSLLDGTGPGSSSG